MSKHTRHNAFVDSYAGLIFDVHRSKEITIRQISQSSVEMTGGNPPLVGKVVYEIVEPYYVDVHAEVKVVEDIDANIHSYICSYMNSPEDTAIYYISGNRWVRHLNFSHGYAEVIYPGEEEEHPEPWIRRSIEEIMDTWKEGKHLFGCIKAEKSFDYPFFCGRIHKMFFVLMADRSKNIRFLASPKGGGDSIIPGQGCPAWDLIWNFEPQKAGKTHELNLRLAYFKIPDKRNFPIYAWHEYKLWRQSLEMANTI